MLQTPIRPDDPVIELEHVSKRYGERAVVDDVSFVVPAGSVCGIVGPNGAGKTTVMRMLLGLVRPTRGTVRLLGRRAGEPGFADALRCVGAIVEGPALYRNASARDNLRIQSAALHRPTTRREIGAALDTVGLTGRGHERVRGYSLGMRQRLGIAVALIGGPRLVVLDEPTNGLDPAGVVATRELIRELPARGVSVLVSSHLLSELELMCDRVVVMDAGRVVADGPLDDVLAGAARPSLEQAFLALTGAGR